MQKDARAKPHSSISIFKNGDEEINLLLPFLLLALASIDAILNWNYDLTTLVPRIIVDILLLNVTHNAFTYIMIFNLPEMRRWITQNNTRNPNKFWRQILLLNIGLAVFFFILFCTMDSQLTKFSLYFMLIFIPTHHALSQTFGLSLLYNQKIKDETNAKGIRRRENVERFLLLLLLGIIFITTILIGFTKASDFHFLEIENVLFLLKWSVAVTAFTLALNMFFYPSVIRLKKAIYSARYILWGLVYFTHWGVWGAQVVHGMEYTFVTRKMMSSSKDGAWKRIGVIAVVFVVAFAFFREFFAAAMNQGQTVSLELKIVASISMALSYSHYYLDRKIFQFRYAINRETSGKLLLG